MTFRTHDLGRMSFKEVELAAGKRPVLLIPLGTVEQHGPHLPVNSDNMVARFVAERTAPETGALVAPSVNYGCSDVFRNFPGTISISHDTLVNLLEEICEGYVKSGFRRIVFVNNHGGNEIIVERIARTMKARHGMLIGSIYPWALGYALMEDQYPDVPRQYGHGGEPETSAMLAMFPEDVVLDLRDVGKLQGFDGWKVKGYSKVEVPGQTVPGTVYFDSDELAANGVTGDGSDASEETGKVWVERIVGFAIDFVKEFDAHTKNASWAKAHA